MLGVVSRPKLEHASPTMLREFREPKSEVCPMPTRTAMSAPLSTPLSSMEACINLKKLNS